MPLLTSVSDSRSFGKGGVPVLGWVTSTAIDVIEGTASSLTFTAVGPPGKTLTYAIQSGTFPTGTTFNSNGTLTGTFPNETSDTLYPVTIRATSSLGPTADKTFDLTVRTGTVSWTTAEGSLGSFEEGDAFSQTLEATTNTSGTITYSVTTGSLTNGLSLNGSTGAITGTLPNILFGPRTNNFTITAEDSLGNSSTRDFSITVVNAPRRAVTLTVYGAQGGSNGGNDPGGQGGTVTWTGEIDKGLTLTLYVASAGGNSNNSIRGGGGGGGASAVLLSNAYLLAVAGGGGGAGSDGDGGDNTAGGAGGADTGATGGNSTHGGSANGGTGGTQSAVGTGGTGSGGNGTNGSGRNGADGAGAFDGTFPRGWGYGNGGLGALFNGGGGSGAGGGGYFGGGSGGRDASGAGGGGGSNYRRTTFVQGPTDAVIAVYTSSTTTRGGRNGNGQIIVNIEGTSTTFNYVSEATQSITIP